MRLPANWVQINYLLQGTPRQQAAYAAITQARIMELLSPYQPCLAGTIPLGIDLPESDLDILCAVYAPSEFETLVVQAYGDHENFTCHQKEVGGLPTVIARFDLAGFRFELFGHPRPVEEQNGYRHLLVEARLLALAGPGAADAIRQLKRDGLKTEPAFARYFGLPGDPYATLLDLSHATDQELMHLVSGREC